MKAKDAILPAVMIGIVTAYVWSSIPSAVFQSADQRARIEQSGR